MLDDLLALTAPWREAIRGSGNPNAHDVETRLDVSARHVAVVAFGVQLEPAWHDAPLKAIFPGLTHATTILAAQSLVFGNAMTTLDTCASASALWCHVPPLPNEREHDLGYLIERRQPTQTLVLRKPARAPTWLNNWAAALIGDARFARLWTLRDRQTHRIVPRSVAVAPGIGAVRQTLASDLASDAPGVGPTYDDCVALTREQWESFWTALAANPYQCP